MNLFRKNEVTFAIVLIVIYVVGNSICQSVSETIGIEFLAETVFCIIMSAAVYIFIKRSNLSEYLGMKKPEISVSRMLFYIPFILIGGVGGFFGMGLAYSPFICIIRAVMMICVGFLEEVIFRGFLFRGIAKSNLTEAVVISSVTFGIGHIVNLLNGYDVINNIIQIIFAVGVGFLLVFTFLRTSSIVPCILFHAFNNAINAFITKDFLIEKIGETNADMIVMFIKMALIIVYLIYIIKLPKKELPEKSYSVNG